MGEHTAGLRGERHRTVVVEGSGDLQVLDERPLLDRSCGQVGSVQLLPVVVAVTTDEGQRGCACADDEPERDDDAEDSAPA